MDRRAGTLRPDEAPLSQPTTDRQEFRAGVLTHERFQMVAGLL